MEELKGTIQHLQSIIEDRSRLSEEVGKELQYIKDNYSNERRTRIEGAVNILTEVDLIPDEEVVVTLTRKGYVKRVPLNVYNVQHRGGRGKMGMADLEASDDFIEDVFVARNHDKLLFFTNLGRVYSLQVFEIPEASRIAKGRAVINLLPLVEGERVVRLLCTRDMEDKFVVMVTKTGTIKRTNAMDFAKIRQTGIRAVTLNENDELAFCSISSGEDSIVLATAKGQGIRFKETEVRAMGRQAAGVIGIRLRGDDQVVGMEIINNDHDLLFATQRGYGKRTRIEDFRVAHRGGFGVRTIPTDKRNGLVIGLVKVGDESNILLIDVAGKIIRLSPSEIRTMGRQARGVRLIRLDKDQTLSTIVAFEENNTPEEESDGTPTIVPATSEAKLEGIEQQSSLIMSGLTDDGEPDYIRDSSVLFDSEPN
jgi:DNA gyrase subunit A